MASKMSGNKSEQTMHLDPDIKSMMERDYSKLDIGGGPGSKSGITTSFGNNKTVFQELKLSEILLSDIDHFKEEINR